MIGCGQGRTDSRSCLRLHAAHLDALQPILLPLHGPLPCRQRRQLPRRLGLLLLHLRLRLLHLLHKLLLAGIEFPLPLSHAPQPSVDGIQLSLRLGACRLHLPLLLSHGTLLGCGQGGKKERCMVSGQRMPPRL